MSDARETTPPVLLVCPHCKREMRVRRDRTDPPGTARVLLACEPCGDGGFPEATYYDAAGRMLEVT